MTVDTLTFLRNLLASQVLNVGATDFVPMTGTVIAALKELDEAIAASANLTS